MTHALIYCAGDGIRWADGKPKQLAPVPPDNRPLLLRTVRQLHIRGIPLVIVTHDEALAVGDEPVFAPMARRWLVESIKSSAPLWKGQMIGLLGDVFFEDKDMDTICAADGLHWFGRKYRSRFTNGPPEVFAFSWDEETAPRVLRSMDVAIRDAEAVPPDREAITGGMRMPLGSLWQPYRYIAGIPMDLHEFESSGLWVDMDSFTDDFDTQAHYRQWLARYNARIFVQREEFDGSAKHC